MSSPHQPGSDDPIDTCRVIEIGISHKKILLLLLMCAPFLIGSIAMAADSEPGSLRQFAGYFVFAPLLAAIMLYMVWYMITTRGPVITIAPHGFRDIRIAPEFIPWTSVREIRFIEDTSGIKGILLNLEVGTKARLTLNPIVRASPIQRELLPTNLSHDPNSEMLGVAPGGLTVDYATLNNTMVAYAQAAERASKAPSGIPSPSST